MRWLQRASRDVRREAEEESNLSFWLLLFTLFLILFTLGWRKK